MAQKSTQPTWDAAALATQLGKIAEQSQRLVQDLLLDRPDIARLGMGDVTTLGGDFIELTTKMMTDPAASSRFRLAELGGAGPLEIGQRCPSRLDADTARKALHHGHLLARNRVDAEG